MNNGQELDPPLDYTATWKISFNYHFKYKVMHLGPKKHVCITQSK